VGNYKSTNNKGVKNEMKYICYFEFDPEDLDKIIPLYDKMRELRGKPEYPKGLTPTYGFGGQTSGFTLYEVENEQQIINHGLHYHPYMELKWKPLVLGADFVKAYMEKKK
jgi:hypothetical protein